VRMIEGWVSRVFCVWLLVAAGLFLVGGCGDSGVPEATMGSASPPQRLVVVTPHNENIRRAFERGFSDWHGREHGDPVAIHWVRRGTPQCVDYVEDAATNDEVALRRLAPDLMFGGGVTEHRLLAEKGLARALAMPLSEEEALPDSLMGVPLKDEQGFWHATALSTFGIVYHRPGCEGRGLPTPRTWRDLADPAYRGWIAMADPTRSGSNRFCLGLILQKHGWREGWGVILRLAANCRTLMPASGEVISTVSSGMCLAGLSVNFAALQEAAASGEGRLEFVSPPEANAITPDLISMVKYASAPELAERFVDYCLSEEGQALWALRGGRVAGGDDFAHDTLFRYAVVPGMYERHADKLAVAGNPFEQRSEFRFDMERERRLAPVVGPLVVAACGENHILLQRTWGALIAAGLPAEPLAELTRPLFDENTAIQLGQQYARPGEAAKLTAEWSARFRQKYESVLAALGQT